jgi:hypothetical protein
MKGRRRRRERRSWWRVLRDWLPFVSLVAAYRILNRWSEPLTAKAHVEPQRGFDERLFGGTAPTVSVQRAAWHPAAPQWWDYAAWVVYLSHFFVTPAIAIALSRRDEAAFRRFRTLVVTGAFAGFATYVAYPAVPPWLASIRGDIPPTDRVIRTMWERAGTPRVAAVFGEDSDLAFPVGALPSLHAAAPFLVLLFFWDRAPRWRPVLAAYNVAMAGTLVYTADHFVFDILMGWAYAVAVYGGTGVVSLRRGAR